jgi:hypothetical protein
MAFTKSDESTTATIKELEDERSQQIFSGIFYTPTVFMSIFRISELHSCFVEHKSELI